MDSLSSGGGGVGNEVSKVSKVDKFDSVKSKGPMTMEDLLASTGYKIPILKKGQEVIGKVLSVSKTEILVDIKAKSEGIVYGREIAANPDLLLSLKPGDPIEATVIYPENEQGQVVLSLRKHSGNRRWSELEEKRDSGETIDVAVAEVNRGGIICEYFGLRGFVPASQLSQVPTKLGDLIGKKLTVSVIEADQASNRLIFTQKQQKDSAAVKEVLGKVNVGEKYKGVVSAILPFGIFVEIEVAKVSKVSKAAKADEDKTSETSKIEGLVHISEIVWEKADDPTKAFTVGQEVEVIVASKDEEAGRLNLSIKQLSEDPFAQTTKKYTNGQKIGGTVTKVTPYGAFITIEDGLEGLMHVSKMPQTATLNVGDKIDCEVESIDVATRRISLVPIVTEKPVLYR